MHFDEIREGLDSEVRECHHTVVCIPVDPDDAVFRVHLIGDLMEPVHALAEFLRDTVDCLDRMNLLTCMITLPGLVGGMSGTASSKATVHPVGA